MSVQYQQFAAWLRTSLGQNLLKIERRCLKPFWEYLRDDYLYTLGVRTQTPLTENSRVEKNIIIAPDKPIIGKHDIVNGAEDSLSILPESVDDIFLPHTLEFAADPYQTLREVDLALRLDGHVIIIGFNPWSMWGLRRFFSFKKKAPWGGVFRRSSQIKDWLKLLNFEIVRCQNFIYRPPIANQKIFRWLKFLEYFLKHLLPMFGGIYILIARKKTFCMMPIKDQWKEVSHAISKGMVEPAARRISHE
ncbi:MAG: hypothetical protein PVI75_08210 [Gammaproteobacteria bacterium]|jgi:hypothetical protein